MPMPAPEKNLVQIDTTVLEFKDWVIVIDKKVFILDTNTGSCTIINKTSDHNTTIQMGCKTVILITKQM